MCIVLVLLFPIKLWVERTGFFKNNLKETPRLVVRSAFESLHLRSFWDKSFTEIYKTMWDIELGVKKTP